MFYTRKTIFGFSTLRLCCFMTFEAQGFHIFAHENDRKANKMLLLPRCIFYSIEPPLSDVLFVREKISTNQIILDPKMKIRKPNGLQNEKLNRVDQIRKTLPKTTKMDKF